MRCGIVHLWGFVQRKTGKLKARTPSTTPWKALINWGSTGNLSRIRWIQHFRTFVRLTCLLYHVLTRTVTYAYVRKRSPNNPSPDPIFIIDRNKLKIRQADRNKNYGNTDVITTNYTDVKSFQNLTKNLIIHEILLVFFSSFNTRNIFYTPDNNVFTTHTKLLRNFHLRALTLYL